MPDKGSDANATADFARGRPVFTHTTQTDQVGITPPPAQPIDFESNPDVLALKSAISILQLQRARATADIQTLKRAKDAALADPEAFVTDLHEGRVQVVGDPLLSGAGVRTTAEEDSDSDSDSDEDEEEQPDGQTGQPRAKTEADGDTAMANGAEAPPKPPSRPKKPKQKTRRKPGAADTSKPPPWQRLPKMQSVVRCPPINWAQYGVVGESLDKLHAEQVAAPTPGAPLVLGPGGTYEFKAGDGGDQANSAAGGGEQPRRLVGIAAPYNPLRDKLDKKGKGSKR
jgi:hypothetical protein